MSNNSMRLEKQCHAIGNQVRIRLLQNRSKGPACGSDLSKKLKLPEPTISHHMHILMEAGPVGSYRVKRHKYFTLTVSEVDRLVETIKGFHIPNPEPEDAA